MHVGAGDADLAGLDRLAQRIEHLALEFGQLVEEEDAEMGEADLARADLEPAADQGGHRGAVMGRAERPAAAHPPALELAGDRGDHRHFQGLGGLEGRQDAGEAGGEQRLAGAGRTAHQQIVASGGANLERPLGDLLALDLGEVGTASERLRLAGLRGREHARALEMGHEREKVGRRDDLDVARPGRLGALRGRADETHLARRGVEGGEEHAGRGNDAPVEAHLADRDEVRQRFAVDGADRGQKAKRDREVVVRAFLGQVGRGEVDGDDLRRKRETDRGEGGANAFAAFRDGLVGKADHGKARQARGQLHLDLDGTRLEPEIGDGGNDGDHQDAARYALLSQDNCPPSFGGRDASAGQGQGKGRYSAASSCANSSAARKRSASSAAMQPVPAAVTAWR